MNEKSETAAAAVEQLARDLVEASRTIEMLASRAAEQLEATFFAYSKDLRKRAQAHLANPAQCELDLDDQASGVGASNAPR